MRGCVWLTKRLRSELVLALTCVPVIAAPPQCRAQDLPPGTLLPAVMEDLYYLERLVGSELSDEQLEALAAAQREWAEQGTVGPEVSVALAEVIGAVLAGAGTERALRELPDNKGAALQQARAGIEQVITGHCTRLADSLEEPQSDAIVWRASPARALDSFVDAVSQARKLPDEQWEQLRDQLAQSLDTYRRSADPAAQVPEGTAQGLMDQARALTDVQFEAQREGLGRQWAAVLLPGLTQKLTDPEYRKQMLSMWFRQLITYPRGPELLAMAMERQ